MINTAQALELGRGGRLGVHTVYVIRGPAGPPSVVVLVVILLKTISARSQITIRTLESLIFGGKHPNKLVHFPYKTLKL